MPVFIQEEGDVVYMGGICRESSTYKAFHQENQTIHSNKYCTQLDQLKAALKQKLHNLPSG